MRKAWIVAVLVLVVASAAGAMLVFRARLPDFVAAGPNRELAPASTAFYAEFPSLSGTWSGMSKSDAWHDLVGSDLLTKVREQPFVTALASAIEEAGAKSGYALDTANAMKLLGRECSLAVTLDAEGGAPKILVLSKLDTEALSKDLLGGQLDLRKLQKELQARTGRCGFTVTESEYAGHIVAIAAKGPDRWCGSLLGDTIAVANDEALVRKAIDCSVAHGAGSLAKRKEFTDDVAALPAGATALLWYDLDALDANRKSLDAGLAELGVGSPEIAASHGILDATHGAHSVAQALTLPSGDLYRASWTWSKSGELFADRVSPPVREFYSGDWMLYGEVADAGAIVRSWERSSLRKRLASSEIGKWLDELVSDPKSKLGPLAKAVPGFDGAMAGADVVSDPFARKMGSHLAGEVLSALVRGDMAIAVDLDATHPQDAAVAFAARLGTEGRLLAIAASDGTLASAQGPKCENVGSRRVFSAGSGGTSFHWTLVGDVFVVSNKVDFVRKAAGYDAKAPLGPGKSIADAVAAFDPGWKMLGCFDFSRLASAPANRSSGPDMTKLLDLYENAGIAGRHQAMATYVADDLASLEFRSRGWISAKKDAAPVVDREPRCWSYLPAKTILHVTQPAAGRDTVWALTRGLVGILGTSEQKLQDGFRDAIGMDLEKEVLPALGQEIFLAVTSKDADPAHGEAPVVPGFVFGFEVKDLPTIRRVTERVVEMVEQAGRDGRMPPAETVRESHAGVEIVSFVMNDRPWPGLQPAFAFDDGFLLVSQDVAALRACIDVKSGAGSGLSDSSAFKASVARLGRASTAFSLLDWNLLCDQVAVYAPQIGGMMGGGTADDPPVQRGGESLESFDLRVKEYEKNVEAAQGGPDKVRRWIDAFRVVDFVGSSSRSSATSVDATTVVKFTD